ncbi:MAG: aromatic-ring-hydroxylating dioxygenase subunit beta [Alphaproteobacteria bacterium]|nr:aromatic-ring-hydroxylating dioxygenase subunit beta [Alphaproteobacteria bacterium]
MPKDNAMPVSADTQRAVEQFLYRQAEILDERRWDEWLDCFTADGIYWMPAAADQEAGAGQPNIFYEDHYLMDMRIRRVEHPYAHSQAAGHRTSHVVSNVIIESEDEATGDLVVRSRFHMVEYRLDDQRYFGGKYTHTLKKTDDGYKIQLQRVDIANVEGPFDYVMQVWL